MTERRSELRSWELGDQPSNGYASHKPEYNYLREPNSDAYETQ